MRILLIEDHQRFAGFVQESLDKVGFSVDVVNTAAAGDDAISSVNYDAVVLDLGLPDQDGLDLLRSWRKKGDETPVLILSAHDKFDQKVLGLNSGGDDYLLKPFAVEELVARIRALLRRPGKVLGLVLTAGNVSFDTTAREVLVNDKAISMPRREMGVLEHLIRRVGRVVPKDVLKTRSTASARKCPRTPSRFIYRGCASACPAPVRKLPFKRCVGSVIFYPKKSLRQPNRAAFDI